MIKIKYYQLAHRLKIKYLAPKVKLKSVICTL